MKNIIDYDIVACKDHVSLRETVLAMLSEGWRPYGQPYEFKYGPEVYLMCQAIVKYGESM